jgi:hypothetical protein
MKNEHIFSVIAGVVVLMLMAACSGKFQTYDLSEDYAVSLHYQPAEEGAAPEPDESESLAGVPARSFYSGDLKRGAIWWGSKGVTLEKGEEFIFSVTHIGPDSTPFGATMPSIDQQGTPFGATFPPLDMSKETLVLKLVARAQSENGVEPVLYMQVGDASGYQANAKRPSQKIANSEEFEEYYFELHDIYQQIEPKKYKVNGAMINSLKFFINLNEEKFAGEIIIREIKVLLEKETENK